MYNYPLNVGDRKSVRYWESYHKRVPVPFISRSNRERELSQSPAFMSWTCDPWCSRGNPRYRRIEPLATAYVLSVAAQFMMPPLARGDPWTQPHGNSCLHRYSNLSRKSPKPMRSIFCTLVLALCVVSVSAQDFAVEQLENSPRHHEWITIKSQDRELHSFVAYPEVDDQVPVVIVIHENRGLNTWARSVADQLAGEGYIAVAPDLLSNTQDGIEQTSDFESSDAARSAIYELNPEGVTKDLMAVRKYAEEMDAGTGQVAVAGFCWGGSQTFRFATNAGDSIEAAFVFYGTAPESQQAINQIEAPVYGFYGENDERVNATIERTQRMMKKAGATYDYTIYDGVGHAFMRRGDDPNADAQYKEARNQAWTRLTSLLGKL